MPYEIEKLTPALPAYKYSTPDMAYYYIANEAGDPLIRIQRESGLSEQKALVYGLHAMPFFGAVKKRTGAVQHALDFILYEISAEAQTNKSTDMILTMPETLAIMFEATFRDIHGYSAGRHITPPALPKEEPWILLDVPGNELDIMPVGRKVVYSKYCGTPKR